MTGPLLSILVPTIGRRTLERTLRSIQLQLLELAAAAAPVEVLVVGDVSSGPLPVAEAVVDKYQRILDVRYLPVNTGQHAWGHLNCQVALADAQGEWIMRMDDDDVFTRGALGQIAEVIGDQREPRPLLFRFVTPQREVIWTYPPRLEVGQVGTPSLVTPNLPRRLGKWTGRYEGDFDFIKSTVELWPIEPDWRAELVCITRPGADEDWTS